MGKPLWWDQPVKKKSQAKEKKVAKALNGRATTGSGNQFFDKGDISLDRYLIEHKYTDDKSYSLTKEIFKKIEREARQKLKLPAMVIEIQERKFVVLRYEDILSNS